MNDALNAARAVALRDLKRHLRRRQDLVQPVVFFVIVVTLFAIAVGPDAAIFAKIAPAGVWVAVLLATTINLDAMFLSDYQDGTIEQLLLSPAPLPLLVASKIFAHWCATAGPQIAISVVVAIVLGLEGPVVSALAATLILGSPILSLVGAIASALTVGLRGGAMLQALIILPLYMPTLIFGTAAMHNAALDLPISAEIYFLAGLGVMAVSLAPFAAAMALRIRLS
jgi:heme exporter protein B